MTLLQAMLEMKRLDASIDAKRREIDSRNLITETVVNEEKDFTIDISSELEAVRKLWEQLGALIIERERLQESVTVANARVGLDVLLSKRNSIRAAVKTISGANASATFNRMIKAKPKVSHLPWTADKTSYWKHEITQYAISPEEIDEAVNLLKNELQELEVQIAALNNQPLV